MASQTSRLSKLRIVAVLVLIAAFGAIGLAPAQAGVSHALIQGSGSGWSANAVNQWIADVQSNGLQVVYTASGSAQGRKDFGYKTNDFAVSDIGFQGTDPVTGDTDTSRGRAYAYLPIVAGGTSFPYHIEVGGKLVDNLRLSGTTLAKIFTNQITNWNDPAITKDNNGRKLPSTPIIPVVHSEGSGSTAQLTRYFDTEYPSIWRPFLGTSGLTEYFPRKDHAIAQNGSDGVMNYVASSAANGAIGYDEYSYALAKDYPVAKVLNKSGYFNLPTQYNVAVALTQAVINHNKKSPDYLLQNLDKVYRYSDKRTYPLSSYSYGIIPTSSSDSTMTTAKRQTLADFLYYSICGGQKEMGPIGYSPLPLNLVQASFDQIGQLKKADKKVVLTNRNVTTCDNPTFDANNPNANKLAEIAPLPPACDQVGQGPCVGPGDPQTDPNGPHKTENTDPNSGGPSGTNNTSTDTSGSNSTGNTDNTTTDPFGNTITDPGTTSAANVAGTPTDISQYPSGQVGTILGLACLVLLGVAVTVPPMLNRRMTRKRDEA